MDELLLRKAELENICIVAACSSATNGYSLLRLWGTNNDHCHVQKLWNGWAIAIARAFLASTLLLSASFGLSHLSSSMPRRLGFELLLGAAIAAGWLMRYAAILVLLGTSAARVLAPHFIGSGFSGYSNYLVHLIAVIALYFSQSTGNADASPISDNDNDNDKSFSHHSCGTPREFWNEDIEVAIRLEHGQMLFTTWKPGGIADTTDGRRSTD